MTPEVKDIGVITQNRPADIEFVDVSGKEYAIPGWFNAGDQLELIGLWEKIAPYLVDTEEHKNDDTDIIPDVKTLEERRALKEKADKAIRYSLFLLARRNYPEITSPVWFKENLSALELVILSQDIILMVTDFFVTRRGRLAAQTKAALSLNSRVGA